MKFLRSICFVVALHVLESLEAPSTETHLINGLGPRDTATDILHGIESAATCAGCEVVLLALKELATLGDSKFVSALSNICKINKAEDLDVCEGSIAAEGPILAQDLRGLKIGSHTSKLLCVTLLGVCDYPPVTPYEVQFPVPKPDNARPPPSGKAPVNVVHVSDIHVDPGYVVGASSQCTKPICCRPYTAAEAPGNNSHPARPFGDHNCDAPVTLEQSMIAAIQSIQPAFTIFTGDVVAHDVWLVNQSRVESDLKVTYSLMASLNLVYPTVGNHDTAPVNGLPPHSVAPNNTAQWTYDDMAADWLTWIGAEGSKSVDDYGSYSVKYPGGNLRIISINTIFYYNLNFWLYQEPMQTDPNGQLAWLVEELQRAETAKERVWLISHVPSGSIDFFRDSSNYFDQIVQRYEATIAGLFYGHTHFDEFEIAYSDYSRQTFQNAVAVSYIAPSMTPTSGSPSFRVYSIDPETFAVLDLTQYSANIDSYTGQNGPTWEKYYSAKETYGSLLTPPLVDPAAELTPAFWHNVTTLFETNDTAFQGYHGRKSRGYNVASCTDSCKADEICGLRAAQSQYNCHKIKPGVHFGKRDGVSAGHKDECEGSPTRSILAKLAYDNANFASVLNAEVARLS